MAVRHANHYEIVQRREAQHDYAAADDMVLRLRDVLPGLTPPAGSLPYCADLARERVLVTCHDAAGLARVRDAAFMFGAQLETAQSVISLPFERLDEVASPAAAPVLIFSPGRTGSTLLTRLLQATGLACASEPDMLTQVSRLDRAAFDMLAPGTREALARGCVSLLCNTLGERPVIKLRSQCNARPLVLTQGAPGCRVVFMLRGMRGWATSRHRSFLEPPVVIASVLRQAMDALDKLMFAELEFRILWFETLVADPVGAMRLCVPGTVCDRHTVRAVMDQDSQAGTPVARDLVAEAPLQDDFWSAFQQDWQEARAGAEWHAKTEGLLAEMWAT